eukprot:CAMPEP_0181321362 /NCGR_PEP_ID=MMETSP1101-20121128/18639_1 /TAXON_ID=46948 /ORGANISM="Rhodomonas abbreviata, Strain Caron Lab Isolate" /LENGTH=551 /DNA_ID=CAMNT_0023429173 /DNA_START=243 /DNA_END=1898 /DNA_ORIENTATION=-
MAGAGKMLGGIRNPHMTHSVVPPLKVQRSNSGGRVMPKDIDESVSEASSSEQEELNMHLAAVEKHLDSIKCLVKSAGSVARSPSWGAALQKVKVLPKLFDLDRNSGADQVHAVNQANMNMCSECSSHSGKSQSADLEHSRMPAGGTMGGTPREMLAEGICSAAFKGDLDAVKRMVSSTNAVNSADYFNRSALQLAAAEGHVAVVEYLLSQGANVHGKDKWGSSALMDAIRGDHAQVQQMLTAAGASNAMEGEENTASPLLKRARQERWSVDRKDVRMGKILGEGDQGFVFKAEWRGMPVVCKVLKDHEDAVKDLEFQNEIAVLSRLRHPNLVLFLGACLDWEPKFILTEYLSGGSLEDVFARKKEELGASWKPSVNRVLAWATDLARALCCLHKQTPAVIHRDLKPANLLLSDENRLKLSDFGLSKCLEKRGGSGDYHMTGETGTLRYMAPEVVRHEDYNDKVDVYSFGFVLWYMCTGELPLEGYTQENLLEAAAKHEDLRPDLNRIKFGPLKDLMRWCWAGEASHRPTAEDILLELDCMSAPVDSQATAA